MNLNNNNDTICAPATIPGTGAISIIRISGKDTFAIADKVLKTNGKQISETEGYRIRYCTIYCENGVSVLDNVLASVFRAPHSYTGEDSIEISCHASKYIISEILRLLLHAGARMAAPGEFTQRSFLNGKMDLAQAEAVADVISSQSEASHRVAMNQLKGGYSKELKSLREKLVNMTSLLELELDFSEEDVEFADRAQLRNLVQDTLSHIKELADSFKRGNAIKNGIPVAIVGATNTGKSTLLNALLGEDRAIVSNIAGTTRDTIEETFNVDGTLFRFIDTAGIRETSEEIEKIGISRTFQKIEQADVVIGMTDITRGTDAVISDAEFIREKVGNDKKLILLINKCDSLLGNEAMDGAAADVTTMLANGGYSDSKILGNCENSKANKNVSIDNKIVSSLNNKGVDWIIIPISAKNGFGLEKLRKCLSETGRSLAGSTDSTLVTNIRHYEALKNASSSLTRVSNGLASSIPADLVAQDLREALYHLGSILGEITTDEVLGNIFKNFCVGK